MTRLPFVPSLRRRNAILLVALAAFWLAQALAIAHASRHVGSTAAAPGVHTQLCTDCASMLPLLTLAGGLGATLALARPVLQSGLPTVTILAVRTARLRAFRSRAPPR